MGTTPNLGLYLSTPANTPDALTRWPARLDENFQKIDIAIGAADVSLVLPKPYDIMVTAPGLGTNTQVLARFKLARAVTFPAGAALSLAVASAAATGSTTFTLKKNGTAFATVNYAASAAVGTWTQAADAVFAAGDLLEIDGPAVADATLADVGITLAGTR